MSGESIATQLKNRCAVVVIVCACMLPLVLPAVGSAAFVLFAAGITANSYQQALTPATTITKLVLRPGG